jgi:predicted NUDIX family NTP pyrophosphohydrolase
MLKRSAGILLWKRERAAMRLLLVHFGGPLWARKDVWSIPKGEYGEGEDPFAVARREFCEELGRAPPADEHKPLGALRQAGGKLVTVYALEGDFNVGALKSNTFELEWPPKSGRRKSFPEVDRAAWFSFAAAREKILKGQVALLDELEALVSPPTPGGAIRRATSRRCG